ncbi:MAG TPA: dTMP kinase [Burkholderiales bacterium]|jgi:dTMP kinase|nr:dTMP kinase [Burkholderiales bacterium]
MTRGRFVTFEGIDGAGKSTHLAWANDWLRGQGVRTIVTREPGGTPLGEKLRELLLQSDGRLHPETEALLMFAARRQHLEDVIAPALSRGDWVLCDRFTDASFAYQGGGHGVATEKLCALEAFTHPGLQPDLTLLFDVSAEVGKARTARIKSPDRFEREGAEFFTRVRDAYLERLRASNGRMVRIDGGRDIGDIQQEVGERLERLWKA